MKPNYQHIILRHGSHLSKYCPPAPNQRPAQNLSCPRISLRAHGHVVSAGPFRTRFGIICSDSFSNAANEQWAQPIHQAVYYSSIITSYETLSPISHSASTGACDLDSTLHSMVLRKRTLFLAFYLLYFVCYIFHTSRRFYFSYFIYVIFLYTSGRYNF